ncbi:MAG TPA: hypothetical protein VG735_08060 [Caulobacterales bacterium]|nr:hypothetical protein [Caulobacterales bacterium]
MTITYPRAFPDSRFLAESFDPEPQDVSVPLAGGQGPSVSLGPSRWLANYRVETLGRTRGAEWGAWLASLRGSGRLFYGRDSRRPFPLAYTEAQMLALPRATTGTFDGTAITTTLNGARDVIGMGGMPANFLLTVGDYIGFYWDTTKRSLHRVLETAAANSGGTGSWNVEPVVPTLVSGFAVANVLRPDCLMRLIEPPQVTNQNNRAHSITFKARQHLEA